ncbi:DGQHR domain-containing protein [Vibrio cyclitrophicus]
MSNNFHETSFLEIEQPFGNFYAFKIKASQLVEVVFSMSAHNQNGKLNGVQRKLKEERIRQIALFSRTSKTTYPNSVILSANFDEEGMFVENDNEAWKIEGDSLVIPTNKKLASIIDGQHRVEGIKRAISEGGFKDFDVLCSVYFDMHFSAQAEIFTSINFNQKKVDKSVAYELFGYNVDETKSSDWSPDTLALFITRIINSESDTSFKGKIYTSFAGAERPSDWSVSTACFVEAISNLMSGDITRDRYKIHESGLFSSKGRARLKSNNSTKQVLRDWYIGGRDKDIYTVIITYLERLDRLGWFSNSDLVTTRTIGVLAIFDVLSDYLKDKSPNEYLDEKFSIMDKVDVRKLNKDNFNFSGIGRGQIRKLINSEIGL